MIQARLTSTLAVLMASMVVSTTARAEALVTLLDAKGQVESRQPKSKDYRPVKVGTRLENGVRLRVGKGAMARLRFPDGTEAEVKSGSEIIVRAEKQKTNGVSLFFGRIWAKVIKATAADDAFEVQSANAVAGVRGTDFEVGVADDGSTRVIVKSGVVAVAGDAQDRTDKISAGYEIESDSGGALSKRKKASDDPNWDGWFAERARKLEKQGLKVAKNLDGRLNRRKAKVERLVNEQRALRKDIERLERKKKMGADVDDQLREKLAELERVTARLTDMQDRLQAAFGMFERWGDIAATGGMAGSEQVGRMAENIAKIAADFADMIEEGTDLSEEGMEDMMDDMRKGKSDRPTKNAADELF